MSKLGEIKVRAAEARRLGIKEFADASSADRRAGEQAMSERIGKYLSVERSDYQPRGNKTTRWRVLTNHGDCLGTVAWFGRWRQYTFDPVQGSTFNSDCLLALAAYLKRINKEHREKKRAQATAGFEPMDFGDALNEMKRRP